VFRFTIRDVLWLMALVGLGAAWFADHVQQKRALERERAVNIEAAAQVQVEWLRRYRGEDAPRTSP
jgi:streptomycin 6-kinase